MRGHASCLKLVEWLLSAPSFQLWGLLRISIPFEQHQQCDKLIISQNWRWYIGDDKEVKLLQQSNGRRAAFKVNWYSQHVAICHVNSDNERPGTLSEALPEGVLWETDWKRNGSNATTTCIFSSDTECMMWISVQRVPWYHLCVCFSLSTQWTN